MKFQAGCSTIEVAIDPIRKPDFFLMWCRCSLKNENCFKDPTFIKQKSIAQLKFIL
jgi:hypothetical protein